MGKLTDAQLKAWVRAGTPIAGKADGDGLTFTLSKAGTAAWVLRYRHNGRQREYSMGRYPELSLADARDRIPELRRRIRDGEDVTAARQAEKARQALQADTFRDLANRVGRSIPKPELRGARQAWAGAVRLSCHRGACPGRRPPRARRQDFAPNGENRAHDRQRRTAVPQADFSVRSEAAHRRRQPRLSL